jgi:hypothetical protein
MGEEIFPDALQILDFYHLTENIYSFGKYLFQGDSKQYTPGRNNLLFCYETARERKY